MPPRNIHSLWAISFEQRLIHSEVAGPSNKEMANPWFDEVKQLVPPLASENNHGDQGASPAHTNTTNREHPARYESN